MCGIFAYVYTNNEDMICKDILSVEFNKMHHRGPDYSIIQNVDLKVIFGFHRLAIIDTTSTSNQPLFGNGNYLICNGEIFNYKELARTHNLNLTSGSDCEVILKLYEKYGIDQTIKMLDGEFAFVLYDMNKHMIYAGRDPYGIRPLFIGYNNNSTLFFSSEVKALHNLCKTIEPFLPSRYMTVDLSTSFQLNYTIYFDLEFKQEICSDDIITTYKEINRLFTRAVEKRLMSDRPVGCLLSGGLDSSLVTSIVKRYLPDLHCFSIGLDEGVDIIAARKVASFLNIPPENHHIVNFTVEEGINAIKSVIYQLESYDITTIRASTPQFLLANYIKNNTDIKVLYSGEGADELFAGYQYSKDAPSDSELHQDTKRLLRELYMYDNLRTDRTTAGCGLEVRIPFLDKEFTQYVMGLDPSLRRPTRQVQEKKLLRTSFSNVLKDHLPDFKEYLPENILYRPKEAFSDAVSSKEISWYRTLVEHIHSVVSDNDLEECKTKYTVNTPQTREALYYRNIFAELYPGRDNLIDHYWLPKWQGNIQDPSATVLSCHVGDL
jgi:asparagine synthase (glutamine-hydrolysing)